MARPAKEKPGVETVVEAAPVNDTPVDVVKRDEPVSAAAEEPVDDGIARLKKQLDEERALRERAERERNEATRREFIAKNDKDETEVRLFDNAIAQLKSNNAALKQQFAMAMANQDFTAAADIQEALADNASKITSIEAGKQSYKDKPREQPRALDPVEEFANRLSPRSAAWVRAHPEYVTNERLHKKMLAAHELAKADGIPIDSQEYFESVEDSLRINRRQPVVEQYEEPLSQAAAPSQRRSSPPAAPVSRDLAPSGQRQRSVTLTADEMEIARMTGQTPQEYAAQRDRPRYSSH